MENRHVRGFPHLETGKVPEGHADSTESIVRGEFGEDCAWRVVAYGWGTSLEMHLPEHGVLRFPLHNGAGGRLGRALLEAQAMVPVRRGIGAVLAEREPTS